MTKQSILAAVVYLASCVLAFNNLGFNNFVYQDPILESPQWASSFDAFPAISGRDNDMDSLRNAPFRGSLAQSQKQIFSYSVNGSDGVGGDYLPLLFLTGNICLQPEDLEASANASLTVYFSFNELLIADLEYALMYQFLRGYFKAWSFFDDTQSDESTLYVIVQAPESTNTNDTWTYEIGVSQTDLMHQWYHESYVEITDTDSSSALISTNNLTMQEGIPVDAYNVSASGFDVLLFDYAFKDQMESLNNSWCAFKNGPVLFGSSDFQTSYTVRGGGLHQQFYITGLNASTKYLGVLLQDRQVNKTGGVIYLPFEFETQGSDACSLIYDLEFCDQVAYAVPASSLKNYLDLQALKQLYDDRARSLFTNFSKSLQQVVCNTTKDALFSPLGSCEACSMLYKNWLCSVTIPRCSTRELDGYLFRSKNESRNAFIDENVEPPLDYYEVLPCLNVCHIMVRDCPAEFGFACPSNNATIIKSYFWDIYDEYATCNFVGIFLDVTSASLMIRFAWSFLILSIATTMFL